MIRFRGVVQLMLLMAVVFFLSGCVGGKTMFSIPTEVVTEAGKVVETVGVQTSDASVAKEAIVHKTLQNRDTNYRQAYEKSGFKVSFKIQEVAPGVYIQVMEKVEFKERPEFAHALPTAPSEHPAWRFGERVGLGLLDAGVKVFGLDVARDVLQASWQNSAPKYMGPVNYQQSFNQGDGIGPVSTELLGVTP